MKVREYIDPLKLAQDIAQDRAKALILWEMEKEKLKLDEFFKRIPSLSKLTIKEEIAELIALGLVSRIIHVKRMPQLIEYALTNRGAQFLKCLRKMMGIGIDVMLDYGMSSCLEQQGYIEKVEEECV